MQYINEAKRWQKLANINKPQVNESLTLFGAFALAGALTAGRGWLIKKKKEIADAERKKQGKKRDAEKEKEIQAEKDAIAAADKALSSAEYKETLRQIAADPDIKKWTKEADEKHEKAYKEWEEYDRATSYAMGSSPSPSWGREGFGETELEKIKKKIETFERGKELLDILSRSSTFIGSKNVIPRESKHNKSIEQTVNEALRKFRKQK